MGIIKTNNKNEVIAQARLNALRALEIIGMKAENYAVNECPVDTGALRNSITHATNNQTLQSIVGTAMNYAPYIEFGTGIYYKGGGRQTPWAYKDSKGKWHRTKGMKEHPFIKPAIADHVDEYKQIIQNELKS